MKITIKKDYKSIPAGVEFDIPDFCVLTGKNGSGKSHILEAIANPTLSDVSLNGASTNKILHVGFNGLNPQVDEQCDSTQVLQNVNNWWNQILGIITHYKQISQNGQRFNNIFTEYLPQHGPNPVLYSIIKQIMEKSGKNLENLNQEDVLNNISFVETSNNTLFFSQCAMIFKAYHTRQVKNEFSEFRAAKHSGTGIHFLSQKDFISKYGPPPWELINEILARAKLPYEVSNPELVDYDLPYQLRLIDKSNNVDISVNDLSSGEKVLMSLALAIYNTQEGGTRPDILLLDEPDAPLHPQFSKLLIDILIETIVRKTGVKVIITTHSPSTVAMAPDNSVFEINRDTKVPFMVSNPHAVNTLTEGIDFLKVSFEKRRQIFVESKYDVQYFERLFNLARRRCDFSYHPIFLEPHSGSSNCTDVISIVNRLYSTGNDLVWGIIDFDTTNTPSDRIEVLGTGKRYAVENYILDPLYVCLSLIRSAKKTYADFGVTGSVATYTEAMNLKEEECQTIVDNFLTQINLPLAELTPTRLDNNYTINYPKSFLLHQGHSYETLLMNRFPELKSISRGNGDSALKLGVMQTVEEYPQFLPREIFETFSRVLND